MMIWSPHYHVLNLNRPSFSKQWSRWHWIKTRCHIPAQDNVLPMIWTSLILQFSANFFLFLQVSQSHLLVCWSLLPVTRPHLTIHQLPKAIPNQVPTSSHRVSVDAWDKKIQRTQFLSLWRLKTQNPKFKIIYIFFYSSKWKHKIVVSNHLLLQWLQGSFACT